MDSRTSKNINRIICVVGIIAIVFAFLRIAGIFDISKYFHPSRAAVSGKSKAQVIDTWESEKFGKLGAYIKIESCDNDYIYITNVCSEGEIFGNISLRPVSGNYALQNADYNDAILTVSGKDKKSKDNYCYLIVPIDCDYMIKNEEKIEAVKVNLKTSQEPVEFKICTFTYKDNEEFSKLALIDKEGKSHDIQHF